MKMVAEPDNSLQSLLASLQESAETSFEDARPIPPALNHSQGFFEHEKQSVFMQEWVCVGRADEVPTPGDFLTHQIADVPVLVVRQHDKQLRFCKCLRASASLPGSGIKRLIKTLYLPVSCLDL